MPPDNLSISISANTAAARTDLKLLEEQLRLLKREYRAALQEFNKTGDRRPLDELSARVLTAERSLASMRREVNRTGSALDALATKPMRRLLTQFDNLGKTAQNFAQVFGGIAGGFAGGFAAATGVQVIRTLANAISDFQKRLIELRDTAQQTNQRPAAVEAARRISERLGREASDADKMLGGTAKAFAAFKTEAGKPISTTGVKDLTKRTEESGDAAKAATTEYSRGVLVQRAGSQLTLDLAKAYDIIGIKQKDYKDTTADQARFQRDVNKAFIDFVARAKPTASVLNELSKALFEGLPADAALKLAPGLIRDLDAEIAKLGPIQDRIDLAEKAKASRAQTGQIFEDWFASVNDVFNRIDIAVNQWTENFINTTLPAWGRGITEWVTNFWPRTLKEMEDGWKVMWANMTTNMPWLANWRQIISDTLDWIIRKAGEAARAIRSITGGAPAGDISIPAMPMAGGGQVHGPGSGTSDSILARLSNGEFVINAASTARFLPLLRAINDGMSAPLMPKTRFATGGLAMAVPAGGGTPVHLHLGGNSFPLNGAPTVVSALVVEARRQQVRSAGTKPSWYGGR